MDKLSPECPYSIFYNLKIYYTSQGDLEMAEKSIRVIPNIEKDFKNRLRLKYRL